MHADNIMAKFFIVITYKAANGNRIRVEGSVPPVKERLEQSYR